MFQSDLGGAHCLRENCLLYRGNKGLFVLLNKTKEGPGRTVKQEQEEISRNHVQVFIPGSVLRRGSRTALPHMAMAPGLGTGT